MKKKFYKLMLLGVGGILPKSYYPMGTFSKKFRVYCASKIVKQIGENVNIEKGALVQESTVIGNNSGIGVNCVLSEFVTVGDNVMMGPECNIYTNSHKFNKITMKYEGYTEYSPVVIEDDVWIGSRVTILPGVIIGKGCTIGAGSVVTKSVPPYTVAAGNPAKVVKNLLA